MMPTIPRAEQSRAEQSRVLRYDYMRVVLVILVVLSHCSYYDIITPFGGIYYQTMMLANGISDTKVHLAIKIISNYLYSFHMPGSRIASQPDVPHIGKQHRNRHPAKYHGFQRNGHHLRK